jgi:hypothetical protein
LRARANDDEMFVGRRELIETLGKIGGDNQDAVDALAACLNQPRSGEAVQALLSFGEAGAESLFTMALHYAKGPRADGFTSEAAAYSAIRWKTTALPNKMAPVFQRHFERGDKDERRIASFALAGIGEPAIPLLTKYVEGENRTLSGQAAEALATMNFFARHESPSRPEPVSASVFFPKLKKVLLKSEDETASQILWAMMAIDREQFMSDPTLIRAWQTAFIKARERGIEKEKTEGRSKKEM